MDAWCVFLVDCWDVENDLFMQDEGDLHLAVACLGTRILFPDWSCIFLSVKFVEKKKLNVLRASVDMYASYSYKNTKEHKIWIADNTVIVCDERF